MNPYNLNVFDRAISWFSPETALRRARYRAALAYEGARLGRTMAGWSATNASANAEIGPALATLRARSRALYRDEPLARKAVAEIVYKTIGAAGMMPKSRAGNKRDREAIDRAFKTWSEGECDSYGRSTYVGLQKLGVKTLIESGECLLRFRPRFKSDGLAIWLQLQLLEPDFIDGSRTNESQTGYVIHGVEHDMLDRRTGYWLFGSHPGESINTWGYKRQGFSSRFVPASEISHGYEIERIGQVRGVPRCAPVITAMRALGDYHEAVQVKKKIEACFSAFVELADEAGGVGMPGGKDESTGQRIENFQPGMIQYLRLGERIQFANPSSSGSEPDYIRLQQRVIAAGWQIPYEILTGDLSQINYSSYRGGLLGFRDMIEDLRWNTVVPFICLPVWRRVIDQLVIQGEISEPDYAVEWSEPKFDMLDRAAEAEADTAAMRNGTMTWGQAVSRQGYDPDEQVEEIARWNQRFDDLGIKLESDARNDYSKQGDASNGKRSSGKAAA